jgi:hypothetical protein
MIIEIKKPDKYVNSKIFLEETGYSFYQENEKYFIAGETDEETLLAAWDNHKPVNPKLAEKAAKKAVLDKLGITADEARLLFS